MIHRLHFPPLTLALALLATVPPALESQSPRERAGHAAGDTAAPEWRMPPMPVAMPMFQELMRLTPRVAPFLPGLGLDPESLPLATYRRVEQLADGDTLALVAGLVRRRIGDRTFVMYGFNEQYPGPLIRVVQGATITVEFTNRLDLPTTVHWHGVRIENRFDGVPGVTQDPVFPGESFTYEVRFPDAGIYWYHPHLNEVIQQDLGLYGNMLVDSPDPEYMGPANGEEFLMLDDILIDERGLFPFGEETSIQSLMGRFGNVLLVNGEPRYELTVQKGSVYRFYLTDVSNTRTFNLLFNGAPTKIVAADIGKFEHEEWVGSVAIAPAQRYVVDVMFDEPGQVALTNSIQAIDHFNAVFYPRVDTLGVITVLDEPAEEDHARAFGILRENADVTAEIDAYRAEFSRPVDRELELTMRTNGLPTPIVAILTLDTLYFPPVEWNDAMPMMNYLSSARNVEWILRDVESSKENMEIDWHFREGEVAKIRIHNRRKSFHPMQHPIHLHGQRFLVISRDGVPNGNLAWKDTAVIPVGATFDILLEASNPGKWMLHCHIAEHLEAGMMTMFTVDPAEGETSR